MSDKWGGRALVCQRGGGRTIRHDAIRNVCYSEADDGCLRPVREKAGLLPARPASDGLPEIAGDSGRRPADVWLPRGASGNGEALDFAVTSGMRADLFRQAAEAPEVAFQRYEQYKRDYKQTESACKAAGFRFIPMVLEAHAGGWSPTARGVLDWIARQAAAASGDEQHAVSLRIAQRLSCVLHRENARAILNRSRSAEAPKPPSGWDNPGDWEQ